MTKYYPERDKQLINVMLGEQCFISYYSFLDIYLFTDKAVSSITVDYPCKAVFKLSLTDMQSLFDCIARNKQLIQVTN